jgi:methionine sulfoxide reductase heme-binding subunit
VNPKQRAARRTVIWRSHRIAPFAILAVAVTVAVTIAVVVLRRHGEPNIGVRMSAGRGRAFSPPLVTSGASDDSLKREAHFAGYVAYALMFATVVWGILTSAGTVRRWLKRQTIYGGHMIFSVMAMSFAALHAASHLFKSQDRYRLMQLVVPFASPFHVGIGVVAFELMIATAVSVWLQRRLSYRRWQLVHRVAYGSYLLAIGHVALSAHHLTSGPIVVALVTTAAVVGLLAILRFLPAKSNQRPVGALK